MSTSPDQTKLVPLRNRVTGAGGQAGQLEP